MSLSKESQTTRSIRLLFYRILLWCYPSEVRRTSGIEMAELFWDMSEAERDRRSLPGYLWFLTRSFLEVPKAAASAHLEVRSKNRVPSGGDQTPKNLKKKHFEQLIMDFRYGWRSLRKRPLYTIVSALTLGLGIGAATSIFSVVEGVLLRELPYENSDQLVQVWIGYPEWGQHMNLRYDQYLLWRENNTQFQDVAVYQASTWGKATVTEIGRPQQVSTGTATASLLPVLGVDPIFGRWFSYTEEGTYPGGAASVAVISHSLWIRLYGQSQSVVGQSIVVDGVARTIIGVLPEDFRLRRLGEPP